MAEVGPLVAALRRVSDRGPGTVRYQAAGHEVDILTRGVGMVATSTWSARALAREPYDLAVNVGVCGSFRAELEPGTVVHVISDCIAELGAEDGDAFLTVQQLPLLGEDEFPFK